MKVCITLTDSTVRVIARAVEVKRTHKAEHFGNGDFIVIVDSRWEDHTFYAADVFKVEVLP